MTHKNKQKVNKFSVSLSILIHLLLLSVLIFIKTGLHNSLIKEYTTLSFSEYNPEKKVSKPKPVSKPQNNIKKANPNIIEKKKEEKFEAEIIPDTTVEKNEPKQTVSVKADTNEFYLKYARSLLDTFLIKHPEYAKMILKEKAKEIAKKKFRKTLEQKINDELRVYLKKNLPKGTEHQINPYTGPGLNIPIDDLIDIVGKIFK